VCSFIKHVFIKFLFYCKNHMQNACFMFSVLLAEMISMKGLIIKNIDEHEVFVCLSRSIFTSEPS
jgi:hypothetical protein